MGTVCRAVNEVYSEGGSSVGMSNNMGFFPVSKYFRQKACLGASSATAVVFSKGKSICQIRMLVLEFSNILG